MKLDALVGALRWMLAALMVLGGMISARSQGSPNFKWLAGGGSAAWVLSVALSPDGKVLAAAAAGIELRNAENGSVIRLHGEDSGFGYPAVKVALSPDGKTVAGGFSDGPIILWDVETGALVRKIGFRVSPRAMTFSPDGKHLVAAGYPLTFWNVQTGVASRTLPLSSSTYSVVYSPDGGTLATASADGMIRLWDVNSVNPIPTILVHGGEVRSVAFSRDGRTLTSVSTDRTLKIWDVGTSTLIRTISSPMDRFNSAVFLADGKTIATGSNDSAIKVWDTVTGTLKRTFTGHRGEIASLAVSSDGKKLASGSTDSTYRLWDVETGTPVRLPSWRGTSLPTVSPDGQSITFGSEYFTKTVKVWALESGDEISSIESNSLDTVTSSAFGADGKTLVTTDSNKTIKLWNPKTATVIRSIVDPEFDGYLVTLSPDRRVLALASTDGTVRLRDSSTLGHLRTLSGGPSRRLRSVAFSPDGRKLAVASGDQIARIWDVQTGSLIRSLEGHSEGVLTVSFSPDGFTLASGSLDNSIKLWNVESGVLIRTLIGHAQSVLTVVFSPDGETLGSAGVDSIVRIWDPSTGSQLNWYNTEPTGMVRNLLFSPDGATIILPGITLGAFPNPYARVIKGNVDLGGWNGSTAGVRAEVEIFPVGSTVALQTTTAWLREDGKYSFAMQVPAGTYDVAAKGPTWLKQRLSLVSLSATGAEDVSFALINGDCDGDNEVTIFDYIELSNAFTTVPGDPGWNANADLDGDGEVTTLDYIILGNNFGLQGD